MTHVKAACPKCPYSRQCPPGALGGSPPETYIGQSFGPFVLPCHVHCDFKDPNWKANTIATPQCAGAAIFRANVGVAPLLPPVLHKLPADHEAVFSSPEEFYAHHTGLPMGVVRAYLRDVTPAALLEIQLARNSNINFSEQD